MKRNLDELDQDLMEAILALDVKRVEASIKAGASVIHKRKRDNMPIGPSVTPVILSHRMKDIVSNPGVKIIRKFPTKVLELLKEKVKEHTNALGKDEVPKRIKRICEVIAKKLGMPYI